MIISEHESRIKSLVEQRRRMTIAIAFLAALVFIQTVSIFSIARKQDRILVMPPEIKESFWLDSNSVSDSYLRQVADYFIKTAMTVSPSTVESQYQYLLNNAYPAIYGDMKGQLLKRGNDVKQKGISTVFTSKSFQVDTENLRVIVSGELMVITGRNRAEPLRKQFSVHFKYENGRLYLKEINEVLS